MVTKARPQLAATLNRRGFLAASACVPTVLRAAEARSYPRLAVLEWAMAEIVLALGVKPLAVVEAPYYRRRVVEPALPDAVIDLGLRAQPNLSLLSSLKPKLIVGLSNYGPPLAALRPIAPTLQFAIHGPERHPFERSVEAMLNLAQHLGREAAAAEAMRAAEAQFAALREKLSGYDGRPVLVANFADERRADIFGAGSQFDTALSRLGIPNAYSGPTNGWGFSTLGLEAIARIGGARLVALSPGVPPGLLASELWAALPLVREHLVVAIEPVWVYGAWPSALRFARLIVEALKRSAP